ncbi:hypothetical protein K1719_016446 [Acacia pycnantha]|nr:hypothetical protein K1719_016446 [Acacia pycnantha]
MEKEKEESPRLSDENLRPTKKVRIRPEGADGEAPAEHAGSDISTMAREAVEGVSYRNKLLYGDHAGRQDSRRNEVELAEGDYSVKQEGDIPCIDFSMSIREALARGMERTLVIKLLGRYITYQNLVSRTRALWQAKGSFNLVDMENGFFCANFDLEEDYLKALTGGPWMVYGSYLTVQPWSLDFDPKSSAISKVVAWIRIPGLSFRYYHKSTLRAIGMLLGEVVKIDYRTETMGRGKFACIAVLTDLMKPLVPWIKVDGKTYGIEYEGLPLICFECGRYGHNREKCRVGKRIESEGQDQTKMAVDTEAGSSTVGVGQSGHAGGASSEPTPPPYGTWMQVNEDKEATPTPLSMEILKGSGLVPPYKDSANSVKNKDGGTVSMPGDGANGHSHYKAKRGLPKPVQEYKKKEKVGDQLGPSAARLTTDSYLQSEMENIEQVNLNGSKNEQRLQEVVGGIISPQKDLPEPSSVNNAPNQVVETPSSLDARKHTVMEIPRSKPVLKVNNMEAKDAGTMESTSGKKKDKGAGKENRAVNLVGNKDRSASANMSIIRRIQTLLSQGWRITIVHVFREGNRCADYLATYALTKEAGLHVLEEPPGGIHDLLRQDAEEVGVPRVCGRTF